MMDNDLGRRGFTIVELLIVVVVIAVLAAIVMVSYNGIATRASTASAQASMETVIKKVEVSRIESSKLPLTLKSVAIQGFETGDTRIEYMLPMGIRTA